jgi:preprotein translocase subunit SecY
MKKFIETLKNIWKIKELRTRILLTLGLLTVFRFGSYVVLPWRRPAGTSGFYRQKQPTPTTCWALSTCLPAAPLITHQYSHWYYCPISQPLSLCSCWGLLCLISSVLQQKEGESGRRKLNQITRLLTVAITLVQGGAYLTYV